jgi:dihydroneopterin aldolase
MLASVSGGAEATLVLGAGADIIDLKDPRAGALGALPAETIATCVAYVGGRRPLSATVGDLPMAPSIVVSAVARTAALGLDFVKLGLFPDGDARACIDALERETAKGTRLVAVMFADRAPDFGLIDRLADRGFAGVMLDTADKRGGGLRDHLDARALEAFVTRAKARDLLTGLAGSLHLEDIPALIRLAPDYLGFRGALCAAGKRGRTLDAAAVRAVRAAIDGAVANTGRQTPAIGGKRPHASTSSA